eukprot:jgi/Chlat1/7949/Chrsp68S07375
MAAAAAAQRLSPSSAAACAWLQPAVPGEGLVVVRGCAAAVLMGGGVVTAGEEEDETGEVIVYSLEKLSLSAEPSSSKQSRPQQPDGSPSPPSGLLSPAGAEEEPSEAQPEGDGSAAEEDEWETAAEQLVPPVRVEEEEEEEEEEDWERVEVPAVQPAPSGRKPAEAVSAGKRGRGAFRYGGETDSLHSDGDKAAACEHANGISDNRSRTQGCVGESNEHVLEVHEFSPAIRTSEVEKLFAGYDQDGLAIKWVDDTHALAIFRSTAAAQAALRGVKDARFRIRRYVNASPAVRIYSHAELLPAPPRPATTATVAHRLIMGTLRKQGVSLPPSQYTNQLRAEERQLAGERLRRQANRNSARASAWDD